MFDVDGFSSYGIKMPGIYIQDQKYRNDSDQKIMKDTEYPINNQTEFEQCSIYVNICAETILQLKIRGNSWGILHASQGVYSVYLN
jgi:hypothetical protein